MPHSPSQPMSLASEPQSEVDVALRILSSSSSLQSESARVMPLPGHTLSALGINNIQHESSASQVILSLLRGLTLGAEVHKSRN